METSQKLADILNAPPEHLRAAIRIFCTKNKEARNTIAEYLSMLREQKPDRPTELEFCKKCEKPFFEADNRDGACWFHDGQCLVDDDASVWNDWEEEHFGFKDDPCNQEENPDGFLWTCCNRRAAEQGCKNHKHEPLLCSDTLQQPPTPKAQLSDASVKRAREEHDELKVCERCNRGFTDASNSNNACNYHTSPIRLNSTAMIWRHPNMPWPEDTPHYRRIFPEGFVYDCCGRDGTPPACRVGPHKAREDKRVKESKQ
ncbi:hypothetical protein QBC41DRAFT_306938 [Cercophora samala]|uniref:C2H2-type domain-containing protein n=1 Tax=Cercophora samala TaxID=330535 RepID=A0AA40D615_9PEZI|nr:hypothetical protein QBC41DRAFT_306938 [Cercophora samala]